MNADTLDPIELTRQLVRLETPTGHEGPAVAFLADALTRLGYQVTRQPVSPGRDNVYAWRETPELVFSTHLDCVPPYVALREDEANLYGRGTCDAKGLAAAMVAAAERLAARGERRIGLLFVVGEENGSDGAERANELMPKGRFLVNGEPTENRLSLGQKGSLKVVLESQGRAAHSGYPELGRSAIHPLLDTLERIRRLPLPTDPMLGSGTLNVGIIQGGVAPNVMAPSARAELLFRLVGPSDELRRQVAAQAADGVVVTFPTELPYFKNRAAAPSGWDTTVVSYASDLAFYSAWGEGYQLGPGTIRVAHTSEEQIGKAELLRGVELYVKLASDLLSRPRT
ncbi:MAG TPA: M20/M25/M40 family metallo-hydrolase [Gemmatimonadales bacterium]|nr:M20/M25/M40 family metallo-hydrolase [Gemmatimonadales bacterium]